MAGAIAASSVEHVLITHTTRRAIPARFSLSFRRSSKALGLGARGALFPRIMASVDGNDLSRTAGFSDGRNKERCNSKVMLGVQILKASNNLLLAQRNHRNYLPGLLSFFPLGGVLFGYDIGATSGASVSLKLLMTGVAVLKVDQLGRRPLLIGGVSGIVVSLFLLAAYYNFFGGAPILAVVALLLYVGCYQVSVATYSHHFLSLLLSGLVCL